MHHSIVDFWRYVDSLEENHEDRPSPRVCRLLEHMFKDWHAKPGWLTEQQVGHLFLGRRDLSRRDAERLSNAPIAIRKALATQRMLELIVDQRIAEKANSCRVRPEELIVGTLPPFSVGQGKEFVRYLTDEERLRFELQYLNELSPMGHIVPNHGLVLEKGLSGLMKQAQERGSRRELTDDQRAFYKSVEISLEAVGQFAAAYARRVRELARSEGIGEEYRTSLLGVAECLAVAPWKPAKTFHQALQAIHIVHCALHWTVEIVPIGRLDQLLDPYYQADRKAGRITPGRAQELIECFWIKLDERVILNRRHAENRFTSADGVLTGFFGSSNFDQGGLLNQWMQQITIGGQRPNNAKVGQDACNDVTRMCLTAARRLPLNSPTLDLRVHRGTPADVIQLAARALMSGGAHPVILNDDVIVPALMKNAGDPIPLAAARDYGCDGCYETMVAGQSEFSFGFVWALDSIEKALNRGAGLAASGPIHLRGTKDSWRTKPAAEIENFEEFLSIVREHMLLSCHRYLNNLTTFYGNKTPVAPSPLLSALISGCVEKGQDLTAGGANYHVFSPLLIGVSNAGDSLHVIRKLVFENKAFSLEELTSCLATDWGNKVISVEGQELPAFGRYVEPDRARQIRSLCLAEPRFGNGQAEVDQWAWWLLQTFADCVKEARTSERNATAIASLKERYGSAKHPFSLSLAPGVGTFEQYVFCGTFSGASADGRRSNQPIASDLSPAPIPADLPATTIVDGKYIHERRFDLGKSVRSFQHNVMKSFGDGAPVDYNVPEDMPPETVARTIRQFIAGKGGSICTFTASSPETFAAAQMNPERFDLVRVRMGGWTEFFVALFPDHQEQHKRRPLYE